MRTPLMSLAARGVMQRRALAGAPLNIMIGFAWRRGRLFPVAIVEYSEDRLHVWPPCFGMAANGTLAVGERATRSELRCVLSTSACRIRSGQALPGALPDAPGQGHRGISTSYHLEESLVSAWVRRQACAHRPERRLFKMPPAWALLKRRCRDHQARTEYGLS